MNNQITLKLTVELPDAASAARFENTVRARIAAFVSVRQSETKLYWKNPEWFEVFFSLQPSIDPELAFNGILSCLGEGWERHDISNEDQWAVWNLKAGSSFFSSNVRWANVERFPELVFASQ